MRALSFLRPSAHNRPMARFQDLFPALRSTGPWTFCNRVWQQVNEDNIFTWATALAYSWLFAIFPFLIVLMSLIGRLPVPVQQSAQKLAHDLIVYSLPGKANAVVMNNVDAIIQEPRHS